MSRSTKYIAGIYGAIIIFLLIIPYLISLNSYKDTITSQVREQVGRDLKIDGNISFAILPCPKIKLTKLKLASLPQAKYPNLIEVEAIEAKLALLPLLTGKITLSSLELEKPVINLEKLPNGKNTWELQIASAQDAADNAPSPAAAGTDNNSNPLRSLPFIINDIRIKDGSLRCIEGGNVTSIDNMDLGIKIADVDGPVNLLLGFRALGKDLTLKGTIKEIAEKMPISLELSAFNDKININGIFDISAALFTGQVKALGDLKNLGDLIPEGLQHQHNFTAEISADKEKIAIKDIKLDVDSVKGDGNITYNLSNSAIDAKLNFNPGNITLSATSGKQHQESASGQVHLSAGNLDAFIKALKVDSSKLPLVLNSDLSLNTEVLYGNQSLLLSNATFTLGKIRIKGDLGVKNWTAKPSLPYDIIIADTDSLLKLLGHNLPLHLGQVHIKGEAIIEKEAVVTNTQITTAKSTITSKGKINTKEGAKSSIAVTASGGSLGQTLHELLSTSYNSGLSAFNIEAQVEGDLASGKHLSLVIGKSGKSTLTIGGEATNVNSTLELTAGSGKPHFALDLALSTINLGKLTAANSSRSSSHAASSGQRSDGGGHWSHDKIDLSGLGSANGTISLKVHRLIDESLVFDNINMKSELADGVLKISALTGGLYGGKLDGAGSLSGKGSQAAAFKASLKGASLRNIMPEGSKIKVTDGIIDFSCDLHSEGLSQFEYVSHLKGDMHLNGKDGKISGMDLQKITHLLRKPKDLASLGKDLGGTVNKGETAFNKLGADIAISKGIMSITHSELTSHEVSASATGQVNLPQFSLDSMVTVNTGVKNLPPLKMHLYGSLDNPQHKLDMKAIGQYLIDNALVNTLDNIKHGKTNPKDLLKGILKGGDKKSGDGDESAPQEGGENNAPAEGANKLIEKGIKSLFN